MAIGEDWETLDSYIGYARPEIITEAVLKRIGYIPWHQRVIIFFERLFRGYYFG